MFLTALGSRFFGPKQYPFLLLLPAEVWAEIVVEEVVVHILGQQQGLPLTFLCRLISDSAWHKYVVLQKKERGVVEKVGPEALGWQKIRSICINLVARKRSWHDTTFVSC